MLAGCKAGGHTSYVMVGMAGQDLGEAEETIRFVNKCGAKISVSKYSPIPHTKDWCKVVDPMPAADPLCQNNSAYPLSAIAEGKNIDSLKQIAKELNHCFT